MSFDFYWLVEPININQLIIIDYIDCNQWLIFIDWYRRELYLELRPPMMTLVCLLHLTKDRDLILGKWKLVNKRTLFSTMAGLSGPRTSLQAAPVNDCSPSIDKYSWFRVLSAIWSASCFSTFATTGNTIGFPSLSRKAKIAGKKRANGA